MLPASEALFFAAEPEHEFNTAAAAPRKTRGLPHFYATRFAEVGGASASALAAFASTPAMAS